MAWWWWCRRAGHSRREQLIETNWNLKERKIKMIYINFYKTQVKSICHCVWSWFTLDYDRITTAKWGKIVYEMTKPNTEHFSTHSSPPEIFFRELFGSSDYMNYIFGSSGIYSKSPSAGMFPFIIFMWHDGKNKNMNLKNFILCSHQLLILRYSNK